MESYDETLFKNQISQEAFIKNLSVYKSQLFDSILSLPSEITTKKTMKSGTYEEHFTKSNCWPKRTR